MPGEQENSVAQKTATVSTVMEPENEPQSSHLQLAAHAQKATPEVRLQKKQIHAVRNLAIFPAI
jgi:hypothetical protein